MGPGRPIRMLFLGWLAPIAVLLVAPGTAIAQPAADPGGEPPPQVVLSGQVTVPTGSTVGPVVIFDGPARIDGTVRGDLVSFQGAVTIDGLVTGDVVSFDGPIRVGERARIGGSLVTDDEPQVADGATIEGATRGVPEVWPGIPRVLAWLAWWLPVTISLLLLGLLLLWFAPRAADAADQAARTQTVASVVAGCAALIGLPLLGIALTATLLGAPFGVGLLLALGLLFATGYAAGAFVLGRLVVAPPRGRVAAFFVGWLIVRALSIVPWVAGPLAIIVIVAGLGSLTVAALNARKPASRGAAGTPAHGGRSGPSVPV